MAPRKPVSKTPRSAPRKMAEKRPAASNPKGTGAKPGIYVLFGVLFGYMLSKSGATDYDAIIDMFRPSNVHIDRSPSGWYWHLEALRLYGVIAVAIATIALGLFLLERSRRPTRSGKALGWESLSWNPERIFGSFLFGAGWALSGSCPGTALAQIGEGKLVAFFTVIGIGAGVWAYQRYKDKGSSQEPVC